MRNALMKIHDLQQLSGRNDKLDYLAENKDDAEFMKLLYYAYNPYYMYKITQLDVKWSEHETLTFKDFIDLLDMLRTSNINAELRSQAAKIIKHAPFKYKDIVYGILTKSLKIGIDTKSINKIVPNFIPTFEVMLAEPYNGNFPAKAIVEEKFDGIRVIAFCTTTCALFTRAGQSLSFPAIEAELMHLANGTHLVFDGELIASQRTVVSGICNSNIRKGFAKGTEELLKYKVFDVMTKLEFDTRFTTTQSIRSMNLERLFLASRKSYKFLEKTDSIACTSPQMLKKISDAIIERGGEGVIVKDAEATYEKRRSKAWQKVKAVNECTLEVVDVEISTKGKRKGKVGALVCESSCGTLRVNVGSGLSDHLIDLYTKTSPVGKFIEVQYNILIQTDDTTWSLFLPRYTGLRTDKTEADSFTKIMNEHVGKPEYKHKGES